MGEVGQRITLFQSTRSARSATFLLFFTWTTFFISIHALREERDSSPAFSPAFF